MAAYAGTVTVVWTISLGSKLMSLAKFAVTNYNQTGIPFSNRLSGVDNVEAVVLIPQSLADGNAPVGFAYDSVNKLCHLFKGVNQEIDSDVNLFTTIGEMLFLVIGS